MARKAVNGRRPESRCRLRLMCTIGDFVHDSGSLFVNNEQITPVPVNIGTFAMPEAAEWEAAIRRRVPPATVEANLEAFARGREAARA